MKYLSEDEDAFSVIVALILEAARRDDLDRVGLLLAEHPELVRARGEIERTVLHQLCARDHGSLKLVRHLLEAGAEVDAVDNWGFTPFAYAVLADSSLAQLLRDFGADPNGRGDVIPLHLAAMFCGSNTVDEVLDLGADLNHTGRFGQTALHAAYDDNNPRNARHLWILGIRRDVYGASALGKATYLRAAIEDDARAVHVRDGKGRTPLHWACRGGEPYIARFLLDRGADPNSESETPLQTPLLEALNQGACDRLIEHLLRAGADAKRANAQGYTPLHLAARYASTATIRLLLAAGARLDARNALGETPYDLAVEMRNRRNVGALWFYRRTASNPGAAL